MKKTVPAFLLALVLSAACNSSVTTAQKPTETTTSSVAKEASEDNAKTHWEGTFSNSMKGDKISFDVDGNQLKNLTFNGYWRCDGKLEQTTIGPDGTYTIKGKAFEGVIKESGFYFEVKGNLDGKKANGTLRFAFVAGGCDTYKLNWTAERK